MDLQRKKEYQRRGREIQCKVSDKRLWLKARD